MQEKDYMEIARIIKRKIRIATQHKDDAGYLSTLAFDLAKYFEKTSGYNFMPHEKVFNRKQFLKDCGVA